MLLKPFVEPEGLGREERATASYELQECLGFCLGAALSQIPVTELDLEDMEKLMRLIDALEDDDDVQRVTTNFEASDEVMAQLEGSD